MPSLVLNEIVDDSPILCMVSGGIDSIAMLKALLLNVTNPIFVHHISLRTAEERWEAEDEHFEKLMPLFHSKYHHFEVSRSILDIQDVKCWNDHNMLAFLGGLYSKLHECRYIASARMGKGRTYQINPVIFNNEHRFQTVLLALFSNNPPTWIYPIWNWDKKDNIDYLTREELELTWSCRWPTKEGNTWLRCHECHACEEIEGLI